MNNPVNRARIILGSMRYEVLAVAVHTMCEEIGEADRHSTPRNGGVLAIAAIYPDHDHVEFASVGIGKPGLKFGRYAQSAAEKINRLHERRLEGNSEIAASVSANDQLGTYGGCIVFVDHTSSIVNEVYVSFSGASPDIDEALVFVIGERLGLTMLGKYENEFIPLARELLADLT